MGLQDETATSAAEARYLLALAARLKPYLPGTCGSRVVLFPIGPFPMRPVPVVLFRKLIRLSESFCKLSSFRRRYRANRRFPSTLPPWFARKDVRGGASVQTRGYLPILPLARVHRESPFRRRWHSGYAAFGSGVREREPGPEATR